MFHIKIKYFEAIRRICFLKISRLIILRIQIVFFFTFRLVFFFTNVQWAVPISYKLLHMWNVHHIISIYFHLISRKKKLWARNQTHRKIKIQQSNKCRASLRTTRTQNAAILTHDIWQFRFSSISIWNTTSS